MQGELGDSGDQGLTGDHGPKGGSGPQGAHGESGETGPQVCNTPSYSSSMHPRYACHLEHIVDYCIGIKLQGTKGPVGQTGPRGPPGITVSTRVESAM